MAVVVKDFTWRQTATHVVVTVPLRGVPSSSVDILTYDTYIKANFKPFIFEVFLSHSINDSASKCTITDGLLEFNLEKSDSGVHWTTLNGDLSKEERAKARADALIKLQNRSQNERAAKQEMLQALHRKSVQQQIELETSEKKETEEIRNTERKKAMLELEEWKTHQVNPKVAPSNCSTDSHSINIWEKSNQISSEDGNQHELQSESNIHLTEDDLRPVPIPRSCGTISVKFTPRAFPTPQRESLLEEEQLWLQKQAAAQRSVGFVAKDLRPEECNPQWLKEKGDSFFKIGNYLGAISAYSHGIKLSKEMSALYVNRSAAHYALGNLQRVIEDCSMALDLMTPKVRLNEDSRAKCHVRRGAALCKLGMLKAGLADLEAASLIKPNDEKLQTDIDDVKAKLTVLEKGG
ncbi:dynein axonemal assembly factor 4-like [Frankliniella occidentalis]|uniref:Dynein axonemal assembly factor 4 n=1 Tax=Frankliniella occidentalis TaxID=133901 RepID=A0A6J1T538_FRAOC|nr:dynein axonemal assembly factor 4-like [Frankliniella occidentalis]